MSSHVIGLSPVQFYCPIFPLPKEAANYKLHSVLWQWKIHPKTLLISDCSGNLFFSVICFTYIYPVHTKIRLAFCVLIPATMFATMSRGFYSAYTLPCQKRTETFSNTAADWLKRRVSARRQSLPARGIYINTYGVCLYEKASFCVE